MLRDRLHKEKENLQQRIDTHNQLMSERARLDMMISQNQTAILKIEGRIEVLEELAKENDEYLRNNRTE